MIKGIPDLPDEFQLLLVISPLKDGLQKIISTPKFQLLLVISPHVEDNKSVKRKSFQLLLVISPRKRYN